MEASTAPARIPILGERLVALGKELPVSELPTPATLTFLLAGLVYYLETGTVDPPEKVEPPTEQDSRDAEIARLKAELDAAQTPPATISPSPVAPTAPTAPAAPTEPASPPVPDAPAAPVDPEIAS
jgi:hypothetical protein